MTFSSSMRALAGFMISSVLIVVVSFIVRSWIRNNGSGDNHDDWKGYLVGVTVLCMVTIPLCNAAASHFLGEEEADTDKKQTIFASCQNDEFKINGSGTPVGVTIYKSPIPWIIRKTSEYYPKTCPICGGPDRAETSGRNGSLSNGMEVAWYRYMFQKDETNPDSESNASVNKEEPALDEVILKDKSFNHSRFRWWNRDLAGLKEAVATFEGRDHGS